MEVNGIRFDYSEDDAEVYKEWKKSFFDGKKSPKTKDFDAMCYTIFKQSRGDKNLRFVSFEDNTITTTYNMGLSNF